MRRTYSLRINCKTSLQSRRTQPARRSPWLLCKRTAIADHQCFGRYESYTYDSLNRLTKTGPAPTGGTALSLSLTRTYWASYPDWQNHQLSIDYQVTDNGPGTAHATKVTAATATNGVYLTTPMPKTLGNISQGGNIPFTLKYFIPSGVTSFNATVYSTCSDQNGASYSFPTKRSSYSYNQANQLTTGYDYRGVSTSYAYDANGALTQKSDGTSTTGYAYNGLDKLTQVTTPTSTVNYGYDALGRRISRAEGTNTTSYHHDAKSDLTDYETNGSGNLTASYQRGADGLISQTDYTGQSPVTSHDLYNPHGDTSALTDSSGNITSAFRYDSFGNPIGANSLTDGYAGKWQRDKDNVTGTIRMGVREYDPSLGRFISADPLKGTPTDPQQRNRYSYVGNDPKSRYDLNGETWYEPWTWFDSEATPEEESVQAEQNGDNNFNDYGSLYSDQERARFGADGNGYSGCKAEIEIGRHLIPEGGRGLQVGSWKYVETEDYLGEYRLYKVTDNTGKEITVSAGNPYLEEFVVNVRLMGVAANYSLLSGFTSWFTGTVYMDSYSGFADPGPETVRHIASQARSSFEQMEIWERE